MGCYICKNKEEADIYTEVIENEPAVRKPPNPEIVLPERACGQRRPSQKSKQAKACGKEPMSVDVERRKREIEAEFRNACKMHLRAFDKACEPYWQEYYKACEPHRIVLNKACEPHLKACEEACEPYRKAFKTACEKPWIELDAACAPFKRVCDEECDRLRKRRDAALAELEREAEGESHDQR